MKTTPSSATELTNRWLSAVVRREWVLATIATVTFPFAVLTPFGTLTPSFGDELFDAILNEVEPGAMDAQSHSVLGGIALLFSVGNPLTSAAAIVLLLFSVLFPALKLALLWGLLVNPRPAPRRMALLESLGPWSMADVFCASILLVLYVPFPGGTTFELQVGYVLFLITVVTGMLATWFARRRSTRTDTTHP